MKRVKWVVRGVLVMAAWGVLGNGCCGSRRQQAPTTMVVYPGAGGQPAAAGCAKDVDCKGDRVCANGQCVSPQPQ